MGYKVTSSGTDSFVVGTGGKFHADIGSTNGVMSKSNSNNDPVIAEYIANITTEDYFTLNITPNPAVNDINIKINTNYRGDVYVSVYNVMGQLIVSKIVSLGSETNSISTINIDLSDAPSGVLIYELKTTNGKYTGKIIKK